MNPITDQTRGLFLERLDAADLDISPWEAGFIETYLKRPDRDQVSFSMRQRDIIDEMMEKYLARLPALAGESRSQTGAPLLPPTNEGCDYFVRSDSGGPQQRCGKPVVERTRLGAKYCVTHRDQRAEFARRNREIAERRGR